ncbi:MAG: hypothetical protein CMJ76_17375 [Planctomycetaceae bacterium]|nr:hypothetical protein [Planctomycetaceae bacterium]|tara:strand:+ start:4441 stop:5613 length:1173 start_codon:yes stop_codon:yes gene_type:complete
MSEMRIAMITRRFWPLVGGAEMVMANLATEFQRQGAKPVLLTAQWDPIWPKKFTHRDFEVQRLPNPNRRGWGTFVYMDALSRWLRENRNLYDVAFVSMLKHSAYSAVTACRKQRQSVVLRVEGGGDTGDCNWHQLARFGSRIRRRCKLAEAVIAPSEATHDELVNAEFPLNRIHHIPNGVKLAEKQRTNENMILARQTLANNNHDFTSHAEHKVSVYTGRLTRNKGLFELLDAWRVVVNQNPSSQLWLIGEGPDREALFDRIRELELVGHILMPGAFDDVHDLLQAANTFILPSYMEGLSLALLEAMANHVHVIASDIAGNRQLIDNNVHGRLVAAKEVAPLAEAILKAHTTDNSNMIRAAYQRVRQDFSLESMAHKHLQVFESTLRSGD